MTQEKDILKEESEGIAPNFHFHKNMTNQVS
jgi:hypothetical protein